jgi:hypothetical protein
MSFLPQRSPHFFRSPNVTPLTDLQAARSPAPNHMSAQEWQARIDLTACYRLVAHHGWTDLIYTHISCAYRAPSIF